MNIISKGKSNSNINSIIQGGNIMNLISMISIQNQSKENKLVKSKEKHQMDRDYGFAVYEALEFNKNNHARSSLGLQIQMLQDFNK